MTRQTDRKTALGVLSRAPSAALAKAFDALGTPPGFDWLRPPEFGAVMVRGRMGGSGAPFNLGEMTVTRCALKTEAGAVGHGYVAGRDADKARIVALCDALLQGPRACEVEDGIVAPMAAALAAARTEDASRAEATRVDFFTMVRGEG